MDSNTNKLKLFANDFITSLITKLLIHFEKNTEKNIKNFI